MGCFVVSTVDGERGLTGIVEDLETGQVRHFADAGALVAALSTAEPGSAGTSDGDGIERRRRPAL